MNLLVFFGWSVKYVSYTRVRATCNFVKKLCEIENVTPIFYFRNKKFFKYVEDIITDIPNSKVHINKFTHKNTWSEIISESIKLSEEYQIDSILLSSMPILKQYRLGSESNFLESINKIYSDDNINRNIMIMFNFFLSYVPFIAMLNANKNIKLYQYMDDPWEMNLSKIVSNPYRCVYEYDLLDRDVDVKLPFIGYSFYYKDYISYNSHSQQKDFDFTTGFMIPYENLNDLEKKLEKGKLNFDNIEQRVKYGLKIKNIESDFENSGIKYNLFYSLKHDNIENKVVQDHQYNDFILKSKYSFIFPSPKTNEFPITRLYYSVSRSCIPFLDSHINFDNNFFKENSELKDFFFDNKLITEFDKIPFIIIDYIDKFENLNNSLNNLQYFKNLRDENYFNITFKKFFD